MSASSSASLPLLGRLPEDDSPLPRFSALYSLRLPETRDADQQQEVRNEVASRQGEERPDGPLSSSGEDAAWGGEEDFVSMAALRAMEEEADDSSSEDDMPPLRKHRSLLVRRASSSGSPGRTVAMTLEGEESGEGEDADDEGGDGGGDDDDDDDDAEGRPADKADGATEMEEEEESIWLAGEDGDDTSGLLLSSVVDYSAGHERYSITAAFPWESQIAWRAPPRQEELSERDSDEDDAVSRSGGRRRSRAKKLPLCVVRRPFARVTSPAVEGQAGAAAASWGRLAAPVDAEADAAQAEAEASTAASAAAAAAAAASAVAAAASSSGGGSGSGAEAAAAAAAAASAVAEAMGEGGLMTGLEAPFAGLNPELSSSRWLDHVVWDGERRPADAHVGSSYAALQLDLNDPTIELVEVEDGRLGRRRRDGGRDPYAHGMEEEKKSTDGSGTSGKSGASSLAAATPGSRAGAVRLEAPKISRVIHALPAMELYSVPSELKPYELERFHRPCVYYDAQQRVRLFMPPETTEREAMHRRGDLTALDGELVMMEYAEEYPLMVSNVGMASRIVNYSCQKEDGSFRSASDDLGKTIALREGDKSPFMAALPTGTLVRAIHNNMAIAPLFKHRSRSSDFLIVRPLLKRPTYLDKPGERPMELGSIAIVREIPPLFLIGQQEPRVNVFTPASRAAADFMRPFMNFHILSMFTRERGSLKIEDVQDAFPSQSETSVRKRLKELATFRRHGEEFGFWVRLPDTPSLEEVRDRIMPEHVCAYESMMSGRRRLAMHGILRLSQPNTTPVPISQAIRSLQERQDGRKKEMKKLGVLVDDRGMKRQMEIARFISSQLKVTPWHLTSNFMAYLQDSQLLMLTGEGNPLGSGDGFSFLRQLSNRRRRERGGARRPTVVLGGTSSDLRKLTMDQLGKLLAELGVPQEEINKLRRWDRVHKLREKATDREDSGAYDRFSREKKRTLKQHRVRFNMLAKGIMKSQLESLSKGSISDDSDSSDDEMEGELLQRLDDKAEAEAERDEQKQLEALTKELASGDSAAEKTLGPVAGATRGKAAVVSFTGRLVSLDEIAAAEAAAALCKAEAAVVQTAFVRGSTSPAVAAAQKRVEEARRIAKEKEVRPPARRAGQLLRRVRTVYLPDGRVERRVEYSRSAEEIAAFLNPEEEGRRRGRRRAAPQSRRSSSGSSSRGGGGGGSVGRSSSHSDEGSRDKMSRIKKLMEEKRALKKQRERQEELRTLLADPVRREEMLSAARDRKSEKPGERVIYCTECFQQGHMKTNRLCPLYRQRSSRGSTAELPKNDAVTRAVDNPLKLKIRSISVSSSPSLARSSSSYYADDDYSEDYETSAIIAAARRKRSRRGSPEMRLARLLKSLIKDLLADDRQGWFHAAPSRKLPRYYEMITEPIHLFLIQQRARDGIYRSREAFMRDLRLLASNAAQYNGAGTPVTLAAERLVTIAETQMKADDTEYSQLEKELGTGKPAGESSESGEPPLKKARVEKKEEDAAAAGGVAATLSATPSATAPSPAALVSAAPSVAAAPAASAEAGAAASMAAGGALSDMGSGLL